jgi:hypothetical protein
MKTTLNNFGNDNNSIQGSTKIFIGGLSIDTNQGKHIF